MFRLAGVGLGSTSIPLSMSIWMCVTKTVYVERKSAACLQERKDWEFDS